MKPMSADVTTVEAAFISPNAASYIASTYTATIKGARPPTLTPEPTCLRNLNAFLDYFLAIIIKEARSTDLQDLKATLARVLDSALGYVALNEAQAELETYRNQETGAGRRFDYDTPRAERATPDFDFNVEEIWLQARIRCMIYSTVGEKEEADFPLLPSDEASVTPPVAIFLTAVLEFLGEHILLTSARFARDRLGSGVKGVLTEDDLDRGVRMDKVLGTIWQGYLAIMPRRGQDSTRSETSDGRSSNHSSRVISSLPFTTTESSSQRPSESHSKEAHDPDQYEQTSSSDPAQTPVILRKTSPALHNGRSLAADDTARLEPRREIATPTQHQEIDSLGTIPKSTHRAAGQPSERSTEEPVGADVPSLGDTTGHEAIEGAQHEAPTASGVLPAQQTAQLDAAGSEVSHSQPESVPEVAPPLERGSSGLWTRTQTMAGDGDAANGKPLLWRKDTASSSGSRQRGRRPDLVTTTSKPSVTDVTTEPGRAEPVEHEPRVLSPTQSAPPREALSPFRQVFQRTIAEQGLSSDSSTVASTREPNDPSDKSTNTGEQSFVRPRMGVTTKITSPTPISASSSRDQSMRYNPGRAMGLGLRDVSSLESGSDYEKFLESERRRDVHPSSPVTASEAEAQRARIVAARGQALLAIDTKQATSSSQAPIRETYSRYISAGLTEESPLPDLPNPVQARASPTVGSPINKVRSPVGSPREPTATPETSYSRQLANFLRHTGPDAPIPSRTPHGEEARLKRDDMDTTEAVSSKPFKTTKAEHRMPIDSETSDVEGGAWDVSESMPMPPHRAQQESLADFLRNVPPPPLMVYDPQANGADYVAPPLAPFRPREDEDSLIAGPAYTSPKVESTRAMYTNGTQDRGASPLMGSQALVGSVGPSPNLNKSPIVGNSPSFGRSPVMNKSPMMSKSPSALRSMSGAFSSGQRAPGANPDLSDEEEDDDDSIYGLPRRKPVVKESLAEFLRNTGPGAETASPTTTPPAKSRGKIGKRLSSLSVLVGGRRNDEANVSPSATSPGAPMRPNHRPLMQ